MIRPRPAPPKKCQQLSGSQSWRPPHFPRVGARMNSPFHARREDDRLHWGGVVATILVDCSRPPLHGMIIGCECRLRIQRPRFAKTDPRTALLNLDSCQSPEKQPGRCTLCESDFGHRRAHTLFRFSWGVKCACFRHGRFTLPFSHPWHPCHLVPLYYIGYSHISKNRFLLSEKQVRGGNRGDCTRCSSAPVRGTTEAYILGAQLLTLPSSPAAPDRGSTCPLIAIAWDT
ncbi:uncharacterized protein LY79DRAFT_386997 [Colletotrichum navitas]|uniref:Uncharacterized protein n=1 Tax=Colletotrichum navitas TaxID=681940 RepID=A0AAD8VAI7_9PEZI|nr:uncharacterized protein LY79DRAFT_386997 [Colletotrichum navitas]KAK1597485.1 hypothetical protein LY79DRAFT_386997 [Colletotrichum navitas]